MYYIQYVNDTNIKSIVLKLYKIERDDYMDLMVGLAIPFLGTTFGAATVFLMKNELNKKVGSIFIGAD